MRKQRERSKLSLEAIQNTRLPGRWTKLRRKWRAKPSSSPLKVGHTTAVSWMIEFMASALGQHHKEMSWSTRWSKEPSRGGRLRCGMKAVTSITMWPMTTDMRLHSSRSIQLTHFTREPETVYAVETMFRTRNLLTSSTAKTGEQSTGLRWQTRCPSRSLTESSQACNFDKTNSLFSFAYSKCSSSSPLSKHF